MKKLFLGIAMSAVLSLSGCNYLGMGMPSSNDLTDEIWYLKYTYFLIPFNYRIYYCPPSENGPVTCQKAEFR